MEVRKDVFQWLVDNNVLEGPTPKTKTNTIKINEETARLFENGLCFATLIGSICKKQKTENPIKETLRALFTPVAKLYNWNLLDAALAKFGVRVSSDTRSLIVAGDHELLLDVLYSLYKNLNPDSKSHNRSSLEAPPNNNNSSNRRRSPARSTVRRSNESHPTSHSNSNSNSKAVASSANATSSSKQQPLAAHPSYSHVQNFLIQSIGQHFGLKEPQAVEIYTGRSRDWTNILVYGYRKEYAPVIRFLQALFSSASDLMRLLAAEPKQYTAVLSLVRPTLLSKDADTVQWGCRVLACLAYEANGTALSDDGWKWFVTLGNGGLDAAITCFKTHHNVLPSIFPMLEQFARKRYLELFTMHLKAACGNAGDYFNMLLELVGVMADSQGSRDQLVKDGVVAELVDVAIKHADSTSSSNERARVAAIGLAAELWRRFPDVVDQKKDGSRLVLALLKKATRDSVVNTQLTTLSWMFDLLNEFVMHQNPYAPVLYKTLIFSLVENDAQEPVRDFILQNMTMLLADQPTMPVSVVIEPFVKQLTLRGYSNTDFDFVIVLAKHPRLTARHACMVLDLLGKMTVSDALHARLATVPLLIILNRLYGERSVLEFITQFGKLCMTLLMNVEKKAATAAQSEAPERITASTIRRSLILEVLSKVIHLARIEYIKVLLPLVQSSASEYETQFRAPHAGLQSLLRFMQGVVDGVEQPTAEQIPAMPPALESSGAASDGLLLDMNAVPVTAAAPAISTVHTVTVPAPSSGLAAREDSTSFYDRNPVKTSPDPSPTQPVRKSTTTGRAQQQQQQQTRSPVSPQRPPRGSPASRKQQQQQEQQQQRRHSMSPDTRSPDPYAHFPPPNRSSGGGAAVPPQSLPRMDARSSHNAVKSEFGGGSGSGSGVNSPLPNTTGAALKHQQMMAAARAEAESPSGGNSSSRNNNNKSASRPRQSSASPSPISRSSSSLSHIKRSPSQISQLSKEYPLTQGYARRGSPLPLGEIKSVHSSVSEADAPLVSKAAREIEAVRRRREQREMEEKQQQEKRLEHERRVRASLKKQMDRSNQVRGQSGNGTGTGTGGSGAAATDPFRKSVLSSHRSYGLTESGAAALEVLDYVTRSAVGISLLQPSLAEQRRMERDVIKQQAGSNQFPLPADYMSLDEKRRLEQIKREEEEKRKRREDAARARKHLQQRQQEERRRKEIEMNLELAASAASSAADTSQLDQEAVVEDALRHQLAAKQLTRGHHHVLFDDYDVAHYVNKLFHERKSKTSTVRSVLDLIGLAINRSVNALAAIQPDFAQKKKHVVGTTVSVKHEPQKLAPEEYEKARGFYEQKVKQKRMQELEEQLKQNKEEEESYRRMKRRKQELQRMMAKMKQEKEKEKQQQDADRRVQEAEEQAKAKRRQARELKRLQTMKQQVKEAREQREKDELAEKQRVEEEQRKAAEENKRKANDALKRKTGEIVDYMTKLKNEKEEKEKQAALAEERRKKKLQELARSAMSKAGINLEGGQSTSTYRVSSQRPANKPPRTVSTTATAADVAPLNRGSSSSSINGQHRSPSPTTSNSNSNNSSSSPAKRQPSKPSVVRSASRSPTSPSKSRNSNSNNNSNVDVDDDEEEETFEVHSSVEPTTA